MAQYIEDDSAPQIKISVHGRSLLIYDNGIGMDGDEVSKLRRIAYSEKKESVDAGHKGIGRLAGIAVAKKLLISTTSYGDSKLHKFEFRAQDLRDELAANKRKGITEPATLVINRHSSVETFDVDPREHYTMVELHELDKKCPELLDPNQLRQFIAEMAPVGFSSEFRYGERISEKLFEHIPDYSPKTIWLTTAPGDRSQIYKPYNDSMSLAEPEFREISDGGPNPIAFCWYAVKGKEMLGKIRPAGNKFVVPGDSADEKKRLAGLVYKLFGFSIGDRSLPLRTLWSKDYTRALWFTGEIHIIDKAIKPTTDRADFVDNEEREAFYSAGIQQIAKKLNAKAQEISNTRQAFDEATKCETRFTRLAKELDGGLIERTEVKTRKEELSKDLERLRKRDCKDKNVEQFVSRITHLGRALEKRLAELKAGNGDTDHISDLAAELKMTSQARKVYRIVMETINHHFARDRDGYYALSGAISKALRQKY
ncbi:MAG: ATP-binding protein [Gemmatimonadota bacterium]|nr:ATP-binding protein [Gemmatimonadota bacterium]